MGILRSVSLSSYFWIDDHPIFMGKQPLSWALTIKHVNGSFRPWNTTPSIKGHSHFQEWQMDALCHIKPHFGLYPPYVYPLYIDCPYDKYIRFWYRTWPATRWLEVQFHFEVGISPQFQGLHILTSGVCDHSYSHKGKDNLICCHSHRVMPIK